MGHYLRSLRRLLAARGPPSAFGGTVGPANVLSLSRARPSLPSSATRSVAQNEARKRRASERPRVGCCEELASANSRTKCNRASARRGRSGTLTNLPPRRDRHDLSPDHPRREIYARRASQARLFERRDGSCDRPPSEHDRQRVPPELRETRRRVPPNHGPGTNQRSTITLPSQQSVRSC